MNEEQFFINRQEGNLVKSFIPSFLRGDDSLEWYDHPTTMISSQEPSQDYSSVISDGAIGLALSGGGAKGAYQAGAWKAIVESGISNRVRAISGTSVGAINAVVFATVCDPEQIRRFWHNRVGDIIAPNFDALSFKGLLAAMSPLAFGLQFPFWGLLDRKALECILRQIVPDNWRPDAPDVYTTALECTQSAAVGGNYVYRLVRFWLNAEKSEEMRLRKIVASCAIPWCFEAMNIGSRRFIDGGWDAKGGDNLPIRPILRRHPEIKTIIAVRCNSADIEPGVASLSTNSNVKVLEIRPQCPLKGLFADTIATLGPGNINNDILKWSGTLAFNPELTDGMFERGYEDGRMALEKLCLLHA